MTFYWWSHWFWITAVSVLALSTFVQTYPRQDVVETTSSTIANDYNKKPTKAVTRLYQQTSSTDTWTMISTTDKQERTKLHSVSPPTPTHSWENSEIDEVYDSEEEVLKHSVATQYEDEVENIDANIEIQQENNTQNLAIKRSAEIPNSTPLQNSSANLKPERQDRALTQDTQSQHNFKQTTKIVETNNFSNYTEIEINKTVLSTSTPLQLHNLNSTDAIETVTAGEWLEANVLARSRADVHISAETESDSAASAASIAVAVQRAPFTLENVNKDAEHRARKSKVLTADYQHVSRILNYPLDSKNLLTRSASTAPNEYDNSRHAVSDVGNISEALAIKRTYFLDAGTISAICLTIFGICCTIGTAGIVLYRRRYLNKPQTLSEPDSSVYIDDSTMRDNSDEMYSLDNDSFLNSLEAMTIQNYWTDTVKHTKL